MDKTIEIKNDFLTVEISALGAEIVRIKDKDGNDRQWNGDPSVWSGRAPIMFPICGGLKNDTLKFGGKEYPLTKHGFAKLMSFECEKAEKDKAVFLLRSNDETKKRYPFDFEMRAAFKLCDNSIEITYSVENPSDSEIFFSFGGHEAYACPDGIENYSVIFEKEEPLNATVLDGNYLTYEKNHISDNGRIDLNEEYFANDALVFEHLQSKSVRLVNRVNGREIRVDFPGFEYFLIWKALGGKYVCLEPWSGCPDRIDFEGSFDEKEGITRLAGGETFSMTHTATIVK